MREEDGMHVRRRLYAAAYGTHAIREYRPVIHDSAVVLMLSRGLGTQSAEGAGTAVADRIADRMTDHMC